SQKDGWEHCGKAINVTNVGNWSTNENLPMGYIQNTETGNGLFWQIEHNGSWHWEISDQRGHFYLALCGPNEQQSHWFKNLAPGESFTSVPVAVGVCR
ncbi:alpha-galactosidase, partial [[Eubacterium] siraeum]|nr:alpha-galactosidase [[Eubacterium] siraeum]